MRRYVLRDLPLTFDQAKASVPVLAADAPAAIVKLCQILGTFTENAVVQKLARNLHSVGAVGLHADLLLAKAHLQQMPTLKAYAMHRALDIRMIPYKTRGTWPRAALTAVSRRP